MGFVTVAILFPRWFSPAEIGALNLLMAYSMILAQVATLGFPGAIIRFFPRYRENGGGVKVFVGLTLMVSMLGALLFLMAYPLLSDRIISENINNSPLFAEYVYMLIPLTLAQLFFFNLESYGNAIYKAAAGVLIKEFLQRVLILLPFVAVMAGWIGFDGYLPLYVGAILISTLILVAYLITIGKLSFQFPRSSDLQAKSEMLSVSFFSWLVGFSTLAIQRIDGILINRFFDESLTGIYTTTFYFGTLVLIPGRVINRISYTLVSDRMSQHDVKKVGEIYHNTSRVQWIIGLLLVGGLWVHLDNVFRILPEAYESGRWVIIWIALGNLLRMSGGVADGIIAYSPYHRFNTLFVLLLLTITIVGIFFFVTPYGINGVAFATFLAVFVFHIIRTLFIHQRIGLQPYSKTHLLGLIVIAPGILLSYLIPQMHSLILDLILRSISLVLLCGVPLHFSQLLPEWNEWFNKMFTR